MKITYLILLALLTALTGVSSAREITFAWDPHPTPGAKFAVQIKQPDGKWADQGTSEITEFKGSFPDTAFEVAVIAYIELPDNAGRIESERSKVLAIPETLIAPTGVKIRIRFELQSSNNLNEWKEIATITVAQPAEVNQFFRLAR